MIDWQIDRIVHFESGDFCKGGFVHFGFHGKNGKLYALEHQKHFLGLVVDRANLRWTVSSVPVFKGVPNIEADLRYPIYIDSLPDGALVVSNFGNSLLYRIRVDKMKAELFVDGSALGMKHAGNCVVDNEGYVWVNEVEGCKIWRFDPSGKPVLTLGDGKPGFQLGSVDFDEARFNWIYDIRRGHDGNIYVLDSKNFAVRMINLRERLVQTLAGTGKGGYTGDGGDARMATFGSNPAQHFDGPISMSLDEEGNMFIGDRYNYVVRMIRKETGTIETIAGSHSPNEEKNDPNEKDPLKIRLPKISSMDYHDGRLFVPTDLATIESGDLVVLRK
jgi:hypothetical protein